MKVIILAGGFQSSISENGESIPKPMVEIGGRPLLWHIMKHFSEYGLHEFIVCGGYKVDMIKEYFMDYYIYASDITVNLKNNHIEIHKKKTEDWKVTVLNTGVFSSTSQRVEMAEKYIEEDEFIVTYGDCLSNIDIEKLIKTHYEKGKIGTFTLAKPTGRNQLLSISEEGILKDNIKNDENSDAWVNADCFVFNKKVFDYLHVNCDLEKQLLFQLNELEQLATYKHVGFWSAIETKRDLINAENLWNENMAPWLSEGE